MKKHMVLSAIIGLSLLGSMPHSPVQAAVVTTSTAPAITTTTLNAKPNPSVNPDSGLTTTNEAVVYTTQTTAATIEVSGRTKVI
ncbi:hypothetical protein [Loigolactobacillus binensis]|uniref:Uncharacterized protein n=1 Tax=Loigolactobacillus binensis TaxID=2559922 RepID=A0ABW3EE54_9LACO|nr:hypothetical protein [Loigolactobacillus binensis]